MEERKALPKVDSMFTLKVDNINSRITPELLREKFGAHGEIGDVYIPRRFGSSNPRGFAFVRFVDKASAEDALRALEGVELEGSVLHIEEAKQRRPDDPRAAMIARNRRDRSRDRGSRDRGSRERDRYRDRGYVRDDYRSRRSHSREFRSQRDDYRGSDRDRGGDRYDRDHDYPRRSRSRSRSRGRYN